LHSLCQAQPPPGTALTMRLAGRACPQSMTSHSLGHLALQAFVKLVEVAG